MGVTITGVNQTGDTLHLADSRVEGVGRAHLEVRRPVPVPAGPPGAERDVQRHLHVRRHRDRVRLRRLSARRAEQLHPVLRRDLLPAQSIWRRVRAGQLARALERDRQLRAALGHHGPVVRARQSDPDHRGQSAVGGLSGGAARPRLSRRHGHRPWPVADAVRQPVAPDRRRLLAERQDQSPRQLRVVLHRLPGPVRGHHVRRSAVRLQLSQPGSAAVRDAVHHRG